MWWLLFVVLAIVSWGCYVPTLHEGRNALGGGALRAFLCVGIAYFITAVLVPGGLIWGAKMEPSTFNSRGFTYSLIAGVLGASGALGIILATKKGGDPIIVASLVFAGAPIVNVLISMLWHPPAKAPSGLFFVGIALAAAGAGMALYFAPKPAQSPKPPTAVTSTVDVKSTS